MVEVNRIQQVFSTYKLCGEKLILYENNKVITPDSLFYEMMLFTMTFYNCESQLLQNPLYFLRRVVKSEHIQVSIVVIVMEF